MYTNNGLEYDTLLLHQKSPTGGKFTLTPPIRPNETLKIAYDGELSTDLLLQRNILDAVTDSRGRIVDIYEPTLPAYVHHAPSRLATPIYAQDANLITSLFDLHPDPDPAAAPIEIFEAGTGIGGLTLHLARAIHAANPPVPAALRHALVRGDYKLPSVRDNSNEPLVEDHHEMTFADPSLQAMHDEYLALRRAVVHTLDVRHSHSRYAHKMVRHFRQAQYLLDVSFHVAEIQTYLEQRLAETHGKPFLTHAFLDLPEPEEHIHAVMQALKPDGTLLVFAPSITQIACVVKWVGGGAERKPLRLEKTLELPMATNNETSLRIGSGGKEWDVRYVKTKKALLEASKEVSADEATTASAKEDVLVCRPMVYQRIVGGGFIGVFRKLLDQSDRQVFEGSLKQFKRKSRRANEDTIEKVEMASETTSGGSAGVNTSTGAEASVGINGHVEKEKE
ncbi:hypothetical protein Cpir12675_006764 [Ceratocystis pirilliformis]|uniref:tRNA (adenine(58)-N(1))-methyltransferase catalytic subunit TRM61 n=1 Tax=Ceratocystis pirilliformis TaxID=259994 RepID=A0ABR3YFF4_9PEZI